MTVLVVQIYRNAQTGKDQFSEQIQNTEVKDNFPTFKKIVNMY